VDQGYVRWLSTSCDMGWQLFLFLLTSVTRKIKLEAMMTQSVHTKVTLSYTNS
jgi:hypothetical protein